MADSLIELDRQLLLTLNSLHCGTLDVIMWYATKTLVWIPFEIWLLWQLWKTTADRRMFILSIIAVATVVLCADQFASGLCKDWFCRLRPTHDPVIGSLVHTVNDYRGGPYGFISSHAANTFGMAVFLSLVIRKRAVTLSLSAWALLCSYSRIYLGVHYPGDILCGALAGSMIAYTIYKIYKYIKIQNGRIPR